MAAPDDLDQGDPRFLTTRWSQVRLAAADATPAGRAALAELCGAYWYPLYAYLRRAGTPAQDAADLVQGFFADFLARGSLGRVEERGGRFRSYLLAALRHHAGHVRERAGAAKRGGDRVHVPLGAPGDFDPATAEARYAEEPASWETPADLFERSFAAALIGAALERLRAAEHERGRAEEFARLEPFLEGDPPPGGYARLAGELGRSEGALKVAAHRLRRRWRQELVAEVARQVDRPQDVEDELRALFRALARA